MDEVERFHARESLFSRERAKWRAAKKGKKITSLWDFENWASDRKQDHHIAREKYGNEIMPVPLSMHGELTRRQREEHPPEGPDPSNPLERLGRYLLGLTDIFECLADFFRYVGERLIAAAREGRRNLRESDYNLAQVLLAFMRTVHAALGAALNKLDQELRR